MCGKQHVWEALCVCVCVCAFESTENPVTKQTLICTRSEVRPGLCISNELSGNDGKVAKPWAKH